MYKHRDIHIEFKARILNDSIVRKITLPEMTPEQQKGIEDMIDDLNKRYYSE